MGRGGVLPFTPDGDIVGVPWKSVSATLGTSGRAAKNLRKNQAKYEQASGQSVYAACAASNTRRAVERGGVAAAQKALTEKEHELVESKQREAASTAECSMAQELARESTEALKEEKAKRAEAERLRTALGCFLVLAGFFGAFDVILLARAIFHLEDPGHLSKFFPRHALPSDVYVFCFRLSLAECVQKFGDTVSALRVANGSTEEEGAAASAAATAQLTLVIDAFFSWGYHWRLPYTGLTEDEVVAHLQAAREFTFSDADPTDCIATAVAGGSPACCLSWAATKLETDLIFAGVDDNDGSIKYLMTSQANFPINHPAWISTMEDRGVTTEEGREAIALGWEAAMVDDMTPRFEGEAGSGFGEGETFEEVDLDFFVKRSGDDIIENGNIPEPYLIIIAYLGMVIFAAVSMGSWKFSEPKSVALYSRVLLSLGGMFVVALSTAACLGFISALSIPLTPLSVSVVPFLSLGIGIDDMIIFIYTLGIKVIHR
ncbi:unnamed protein product [Ectocarpus sp. CCAP 1310/34]|nr:unnamed protein product [Ectocarpus sp. CCAP 1310/34]